MRSKVPETGNGVKSQLHVVIDTSLYESDKSSHVIVMCWVGFDGSLHHYRPLYHTSRRQQATTTSKHIENSFIGHTFCLLWDKEGWSENGETSNRPVHLKDIPSTDFICLYQLGDCDQESDEDDDGEPLLTLRVINDNKVNVEIGLQEVIKHKDEGEPLSDKHIKYESMTICGFTLYW